MSLEEILKNLIKDKLSSLPPELHEPVIEYLIEVNFGYLVTLMQKLDNNEMDLAKKAIQFSSENFFNQSIDEMKSLLLEDECFENFMTLYNRFFELCIDKSTGESIPKMTDDEYENLTNKLDEYMQGIKDYNLEKAKFYYGELLINLEQLKGADIKSLSVNRTLQ